MYNVDDNLKKANGNMITYYRKMFWKTIVHTPLSPMLKGQGPLKYSSTGTS